MWLQESLGRSSSLAKFELSNFSWTGLLGAWWLQKAWYREGTVEVRSTEIWAEHRAEAIRFEVDSTLENVWAGLTTTCLGSKCPWSVTSHRWSCAYDREFGWGREMLPTNSFVPGKVLQQTLKSILTDPLPVCPRHNANCLSAGCVSLRVWIQLSLTFLACPVLSQLI